MGFNSDEEVIDVRYRSSISPFGGEVFEGSEERETEERDVVDSVEVKAGSNESVHGSSLSG